MSMNISAFLARWISDYTNPKSLGSRFRQKRIAPLKEMIKEVYTKKQKVSILDVGGTRDYWKILPVSFLEEYQVEVFLLNLPSQEQSEADSQYFKIVYGDGCDLSIYEDKKFDIAHSNSVIEHVGDRSRMEQFAKETRRVADKYYVQTPNYGFPLEPHCMTPFFHWLPFEMRLWLVRKFRLGHWKKATTREEAIAIVNSARLLSVQRMKRFFPDGAILKEKIFLLTKSLTAIRQ